MTWTCLMLPSTVFHPSWRRKHDDCMSICSDLINNAEKDGLFLYLIVTGGIRQCFLYDPQLKWQWATWKSPWLPWKKELLQDRSKDKIMLELIFSSSGMNSFQEPL
jgi:hypothetical protein